MNHETPVLAPTGIELSPRGTYWWYPDELPEAHTRREYHTDQLDPVRLQNVQIGIQDQIETPQPITAPEQTLPIRQRPAHLARHAALQRIDAIIDHALPVAAYAPALPVTREQAAHMPAVPAANKTPHGLRVPRLEPLPVEPVADPLPIRQRPAYIQHLAAGARFDNLLARPPFIGDGHIPGPVYAPALPVTREQAAHMPAVPAANKTPHGLRVPRLEPLPVEQTEGVGEASMSEQIAQEAVPRAMQLDAQTDELSLFDAIAFSEVDQNGPDTSDDSDAMPVLRPVDPMDGMTSGPITPVNHAVLSPETPIPYAPLEKRLHDRMMEGRTGGLEAFFHEEEERTGEHPQNWSIATPPEGWPELPETEVRQPVSISNPWMIPQGDERAVPLIESTMARPVYMEPATFAQEAVYADEEVVKAVEESRRQAAIDRQAAMVASEAELRVLVGRLQAMGVALPQGDMADFYTDATQSYDQLQSMLGYARGEVRAQERREFLMRQAGRISALTPERIAYEAGRRVGALQQAATPFLQRRAAGIASQRQAAGQPPVSMSRRIGRVVGSIKRTLR